MGWNIFKRSPADDGSEVTSGMVLKDTWKIENQIGKGAFGQVWLGVNKKTGEKVAIKFESTEVKMGQLLIEYNLYFRLRKSQHIPKIYDGDQYMHKWHYIVMECMSASLERLFNNTNHYFSKKTVMQLMIEMLNVIEEIHDMGVIHRDIKPDNWMFGRKETKRNKTLCIIDFGLGKLYIDEKTGRHIKQEKAPFALGTARYMPVRAHEFISQSRRDDLEAIGFVCIYFLNGALPWQSVDEEDKLKRNKKIQEWKKIRVEKLCEKHPTEFADYFRRVRALGFAQRPDYKGYRKLFTSLAARKNIRLDFKYDWED